MGSVPLTLHPRLTFLFNKNVLRSVLNYRNIPIKIIISLDAAEKTHRMVPLRWHLLIRKLPTVNCFKLTVFIYPYLCTILDKILLLPNLC